jgi:monoamine oxidase
MPRRSIEGLHPDSFIFDSEQFQKDVRAVLPQPGFKIFAAYRRPWWKEARGVSAGRSVTDLPVRQCYYWVTGAAAGKGNSNSVLMASYNDGSSVEFWAGLMRRPERYQAPPEACPPGVPIPDDLRGALASAPLVEEMQNQLRELHGLSELTDPAAGGIVSPYVAVCQDWTQEPFGGGWHFWKIGEDAPRVRRRMQRPVDGASLYVCGEAWSSQQGWVEGALETADEVLEKQLRVPTPEWLHKLLTSSNVTPDLEALHG